MLQPGAARCPHCHQLHEQQQQQQFHHHHHHHHDQHPVYIDYEDSRTDRWCGAASTTAACSIGGGGGGGGYRGDGAGGGVGGGLGGCLGLGVELAPISPIELLNSYSGDADDLLPPEPPTVVINSEASPPTEKQKRIARVVMAVAFVLLAICVILVGVTLSMSDHIDDLVRRSYYRSGTPIQQLQLRQKPPLRDYASSNSSGGQVRNATAASTA